MDLDPGITLAALGIGIIVGMTGMGGGALMTPVLVLLFGVQPLAAVSSDLVAAAVMKPVGSFVHARRGTVHLPLVRWLSLGSIPAAFCGVLVARSLGDGEAVQNGIRVALGIALLLAAAGLAVRAYSRLIERAAHRDGRLEPLRQGPPEVVVRPLVTMAIGAVGGLVVGMTSVGSGSLIIIALMAVYPRLTANELVGTDLLQAVPLVFSAALGHILFGDFQLDLTLSLVAGSVPGAWLGAKVSAKAPGGLIRRVLAFVLLASALKLLDVSTPVTGMILVALLLTAPPTWMVIRRRHGFPALARNDGYGRHPRAADAPAGTRGSVIPPAPVAEDPTA